MEEQRWEFVTAADQTNVQVAVDALETPQLLHVRLEFIQAFCYRRSANSCEKFSGFHHTFYSKAWCAERYLGKRAQG